MVPTSPTRENIQFAGEHDRPANSYQFLAVVNKLDEIELSDEHDEELGRMFIEFYERFFRLQLSAVCPGPRLWIAEQA
jgi:hypothetical protein